MRLIRLANLARWTVGSTLLYGGAAIVLTWPLAARATRDLPGDLLDPLFTCWALGWNFHVLGLSGGGPRPVSYWDANIFYPTPMSFARSEHFLPQALQGAVVYAATGNLVLTYNLLFLSTFALSGTFLFLLARDETHDRQAALGAGFFYAFALFRWAQIPHLGALSSQWMPLALLLTRRVARGGRPGETAAWIVALGGVTAMQVLSSGYYLLFFPPFLVVWAAIEARRVRGWWAPIRLAAAAAIAAALALPMVLPYLALRASGAHRELGPVLDNSADVLSFVTAPELTLVWGSIADAFPRGEARLFPGIVTPILAMIGMVAAVHAAGKAIAVPRPSPDRPTPLRRYARVTSIALGLIGIVAGLAALTGGWSMQFGTLRLRAVSVSRPLVLLSGMFIAALVGWARLRAFVSVPFLRALLVRREILAIALATLAAWLSLGPIATFRGRPIPLPCPYRWLYDYVPGFSAGRAPARFAMIAACFGALAAAWGLTHLRTVPSGRRWAWALCAAFVLETTVAPMPLSRQGFYVIGPYQWELQDTDALPAWRGGAPSPIVTDIHSLPDEAVLAVLPFGEIFHETWAMFDSAHHWRRLLNGYSSWIPPEYLDHAIALRDPLRQAPEVVAALRAARVTHVVVHEGAWRRGKGVRVTERLVAAGAHLVTRKEDVALLALP
jgi:hypothetical protein